MERGSEVAEALSALRTVARRWSTDWASAEDLLQDAALRAVTAYDRFREGTSATAWVRTILYRLAVDETRRHRRERNVHRSYAVLADAHSQQPEPLDRPTLRTLDLGDLKVAASELPESLRDTFWLWAVDGLSYQEIGQRLAIPLGTVGTRLLRARKMVRDLLAGTVPARRPRRAQLRRPPAAPGGCASAG